MSENVYSFVRHAISFAGGALVAKGYVSQEELMEGVGAVMTLLALIWSFVQKRKAQKEEDNKN